MARRASAFAEPKWKTLPWLTIPKTSTDLLVDILVEIPGLTESMDRLQLRSNFLGVTERFPRCFVQKCRQVSDDLRDWYATTGSTIESLVTEDMARGDTASLVKHIGSAREILVYWSCVLLYSEIHDAIVASEGPEQEDSPPANSPQTEENMVICQKAVKIINLLLSPEMGWLGINLAAFPMAVISTYNIRRPVFTMEGSVLSEMLETENGRRLFSFTQSIISLLVKRER